MSLVRRSLTSLAWQLSANNTSLIITFVRSVMLARWLPIEVFGVYVAARAIVAVTKTIPDFGMRGAFLHRDPHVADEQRAAAVHFTLKLIFTSPWAMGMVLLTLVFSDPAMRLALFVITITMGASYLTQTPGLILDRRVVHRRLASIKFFVAIATTVVSLVIGWQAAQTNQIRPALWALLSIHIVTVVIHVFALFVWRPVWTPKIVWDSGVMRYFLRFGSKNFVSGVLQQLVDKLDDIWTKAYLGDLALGLYSRAYTFATYPREVLATPINRVLMGAYAELKGNRLGLSKAFYASNAFLVRSGFLISGALFLAAPEFIRIVLTDKWLPMVDVFRLMLLFTLLDPLKTAVVNLMVAIGEVSKPIPVRLIQLTVLVAGLFLFGFRWGVVGVVISVNLMAVVGNVIMFTLARKYVDFSVRKLFLAPLVALVVSLFLGETATRIPGIIETDWVMGVTKIAVFGFTYVATVLLLEREDTKTLVKKIAELRK